MEYSDGMLIKYLKMSYKFLESRNYDIDEMDIDDLYSIREIDFLMSALKLSKDERLQLEYLYTLLKSNNNANFETDLNKPTLNTFNVQHRVTEKARRTLYYEQELESYLNSDEFDADYVDSLEMNDEFFIYDGEVTDEETDDSYIEYTELYDINQV